MNTVPVAVKFEVLMNRYGAPTTYKRIRPDFGSGFILKQIYELTEAPGLIAPMWPTKKDVYFGTQWYNRPGFASLLWSALIKDGLIESNGGIRNYKCWSWGCKNHVAYRATGTYVPGTGYTVRYHLTPKGRGVLFDMMARYNKICEEKKGFCKRNGIEFGTGRVLNTVGSVAEYDAKKDATPPPPNPVERDILEKEAVHCAKIAADYASEREIRKLRAEKNDLLEDLENAYHRVALIETEIQGLKAQLNSLVDWAMK